ncbi:MAG: hypothetical protein ABIT09_03565 [Croceibacterium sp.]
MNRDSLLKNWPVGVVLVAATTPALLAGVGAPRAARQYPVRVELARAHNSPSARLLTSPQDDGTDSKPADESVVDGDAGDGRARRFADAFATLDAPAPPPPVRTPAVAASEATGMLAVRFNLADPYAGAPEGSGPIELKKAVRINGADAGDATIRVTDGATIAIARDELGKLLTAAGRADAIQALAGSGSFVSFDRIRQAGLSVRYDAASDRILLAS